MGAIWKSYTRYHFTKYDYVISFAETHDMAVRGHNLVWVTAKTTLLPAFVREEKNATTLETRMLEYIDTVVKHVGERAFAWDVINEAISDKRDELIKPSPWNKIDDFVCKAFKAAHSANPKAQLFYNDYGAESSAGWQSTKANKVYNYLKELKERGCPIHGVGFQSHITLEYDETMLEGVRENMQRLGELGLIVHITELDIKCSSKKSCSDSDWTQEMR